ncbi:hypothetical protein [Nocardia sp. BMG51109]|uniref:hypothetical protein n=1 Tax=Nocardia sp. BMG51109 TaxID=1056816 RepID=UPI0004AD9F2D|nr:hypothetical protein [Nocardia sp. BMG51109]
MWLIGAVRPRWPRRRWVRVAVVGAGLAVLAAAAILPVVISSPSSAEQDGPYRIGTVGYHWVDHGRQELFDADPAARRELMAQVWYPAEAGTTGPAAPYLSDADAVAPVLAEKFRLPQSVLDHWKRVPTRAVEGARVARDRPRFPVLVFVSGLNGFRQSNMFQVEDLVSRGFVVVGLDQPYASAAVRFPDGRVVRGLTKDELQPFIEQSINPVSQPPVLRGNPCRTG